MGGKNAGAKGGGGKGKTNGWSASTASKGSSVGKHRGKAGRGFPKGGEKGERSFSKGKKGDEKGKDGGRGWERKGTDKGKGKDSGGPAAEDDGEVAELPAVTKKQIEALRSYSESQWWLIGESTEPGTSVKRAKHEEFRENCEQKHAEMQKVYESAMMKDSEQRWLRKVSKSGTSKDKVASLVMLIQVCPVFSTGHIKSMLSMAGRMGRSDSLLAIDSMQELLTSTLLPDRKLKNFSQMSPISPKGLNPTYYTERCVVAFFEDYLKTAFAAFIHTLSEAAQVIVPMFKMKAIKSAHQLLSSKPEQERALLTLLVNKMGDTAAKVSSTVTFCLEKLVEAHPAMKQVVAKEIEVFLKRPNITSKSEYFAFLFLSQLSYSRKSDGELAAQIIKIFVARLEVALVKPHQQKKELSMKEAKRIKRRWRTKVNAPWRHGLQEDDNRLIRTLVNGIQRALPCLQSNSVTFAPLQDETLNSLYKVCHTVTAFSTRVSILSLLHRILSAHSAPPDRFYRLMYEQAIEFGLFSSTYRHKAHMLLRRCVATDTSASRAVAISRRLTQLGAHSEPAVAVAALAVTRELLIAHRTAIKPLLECVDSALRPRPDMLEDDAEEHFVDDDDNDTGADKADTPADKHAGEVLKERGPQQYDPFQREPRYAKALHTHFWELYALRKHVHPFVADAARQLQGCSTFNDSGENPFETFCTSELLESFVLASRAHHVSATEPARERTDRRKLPRVPFSGEKFSRMKSVPPHEQFFHLYFTDSVISKEHRKKAEQRREKAVDVDEEGGQMAPEEQAEEEIDQFFDGYIQRGMPKTNDGDNSEDDDDDDEGCEADGDDDDDVDDDDDDDDDAEGVDEEIAEPSDAEASPEEEEQKAAAAGKKRAQSGAEEPTAKKIKALRKGQPGQVFASMEDFQKLLEEAGLPPLG